MKDEIKTFQHITEDNWNSRPEKRPQAVRIRIEARLKKERLITTKQLREHFKGRWLSDTDLMSMKTAGLIEKPKQVLRIPEGTLAGARQSIYRKEVFKQIETVLKYRNKGMSYPQIRKLLIEKGKLPGIAKKDLYGKTSNKKQTAGASSSVKNGKKVGG